MKFAADRPFTNPETAARKLLELANAFEPVQDGRIYIEKINTVHLRSEGHAGGIQGWPQSCDRQGVAGDARERHLCPLHAGRRRPIRLIQTRAPERPHQR
jgi:hypothetical protein